MRKYLVRGPNNGNIYIYSERNFVHQSLQEEDTPGKKVSLGDIITKKWGLAFFGVHSVKTDMSNIIIFQFCIT